MEQSLLRGESSDQSNRSRGIFRRSDAITYGSNYEKAAAFIDLAEDGVGLPEEILDSPNFQNYIRFYFIFNKCNLIWSLSYFALIVLNFLEVFSLLVLVADVLLYALFLSPLAFDFLPFRIAPYIRVVLFVLNIRELRETITILVGMLDTYLNVLALWLLFLLFASWVAYVFFEDTIQGKTVFTSYGTTLYQLFLLFTTSNNPDVWVPAYKSSRWYCLFFVLFVLVGVYFVTNLILAVVYDSFKSELVKQVFEKDRLRRTMLDKAFDLLDTHLFEIVLWSQKVSSLNKNQCIRLFEELNKYRTLPKISREDFELIFDELDDSHDIKINKDEFADICNAIALKFQKEDVMSYFEYLAFYHSPSSKRLKEFVRSPMFGYLVSFVLVINLVAVIIETTDSLPSSCKNVEINKDPNIFGGIVNAGNPELELTALAENEYPLIIYKIVSFKPVMVGFGQHPGVNLNLGIYIASEMEPFLGFSGFLFQSYKELTGTSWTYLYFISFYLITVLLLLNLIIAFVLEAFFAEMELESSETCEGNGKEVEGDKYRKRSIGTKTRSQRVDALLHHMLSAELCQNEPSSTQTS
ncbi:hypothetical protein JHK82_037666 [Glycine max]|nr:hypothetical protein JHK82_037666 [Glycine max]